MAVNFDFVVDGMLPSKEKDRPEYRDSYIPYCNINDFGDFYERLDKISKQYQPGVCPRHEFLSFSGLMVIFAGIGMMMTAPMIVVSRTNNLEGTWFSSSTSILFWAGILIIGCGVGVMVSSTLLIRRDLRAIEDRIISEVNNFATQHPDVEANYNLYTKGDCYREHVCSFRVTLSSGTASMIPSTSESEIELS